MAPGNDRDRRARLQRLGDNLTPQRLRPLPTLRPIGASLSVHHPGSGHFRCSRCHPQSSRQATIDGRRPSPSAYHVRARKAVFCNNGIRIKCLVCSPARRETRDPKMDRRWPVISEDTEARGMLLAPWGFNSPLSPSPSPSPRLPGFVEFGDATFRARASEAERPGHATGLLGSLICRPMVFRCSDVAWIAASASRASRRFSGRGAGGGAPVSSATPRDVRA